MPVSASLPLMGIMLHSDEHPYTPLEQLVNTHVPAFCYNVLQFAQLLSDCE